MHPYEDRCGDVREVEALLREQRSVVKLALQAVGGRWLLACLGVEEDWRQPARLDYVYDDDCANMAVHYIAAGAPVSLMSRILASLGAAGMYGAVATPHARDRAALLRRLLDAGAAVDLGAINARLETPVHCALRSCSLQLLEVMLTHEPSGGARRPGAAVTEKDAANERPLDIALTTQQWPAVRLLVSAGALTKCPELDDARRELEQLLPTPASSKAGGGLASALPFGLASLFGLVAPAEAQRGDGCAADAAPSPAAAAAAIPGLRPLDSNVFPVIGHSAERGRRAGGACAAFTVLHGLDEVARHRQRSVAHVAFVLDCGEAAAAELLSQCCWDEPAAIEAYHARHTGTHAGGAAVAPAGGNTPGQAQAAGPAPACTEPATAQCIVCFEEMRLAEHRPVRLACGHATCTACWKGILVTKLGDGDVGRAACPAVGCCEALPLASVRAMLSKADTARYERLLAQQYVDANPRLRWCQRPGCGRSLALDAREGAADGMAAAAANRRALDVACDCGAAFCFSCLRAPHEPAGCDSAREWEGVLRVARAQAASRDESWLSRHTKACPGCGSRIQKNGGCNHMVCSLCRRHFCWVCGGDWSEHNSATGGYYRCNRYVLQAGDAGDAGGSGGAPWAFFGDFLSKIQDAAARFRLNYYLRRYQAADCDARQLYVLRNSYVLGYFLSWSERRRYFEEVQGKLEVAVEQSSLPLALMPDVQIIMRAAEQQHRARSGAPPQPADAGLPAPSANHPLPVSIADGEMLRRQFYFAVAVHERAAQLRALTADAAAEKENLLRGARDGLFADAPSTALTRAAAGLPPPSPRAPGAGSPASGGLTGALHTMAAAVAYFWQGDGGTER
ncbi:hypothetical protein WJX81_008317 [Elliptochloris bilobata]|uniref:RBR-type E3 ubiquitin transferase n=1 Tax=Elliptochloris bilobata TaxID=381761 RepID=A0AAW1RFM6_9CHLO